MAEEHNAALIRRVVEEIWNAGNLDLADGLFAPDYVNHAGVIPDLVYGPEAIKFSVALYRTAFPKLHITVDELVVEEDAVELHWTARNTALSELGSPRHGHHASVTGTTLSRLADGQVRESWTSLDAAGVLRRAGSLSLYAGPSRGSRRDRFGRGLGDPSSGGSDGRASVVPTPRSLAGEGVGVPRGPAIGDDRWAERGSR